MKEKKEKFIVAPLEKMKTEQKPIKHFEDAEKTYLDSPKPKIGFNQLFKAKKGKK
jgi:hypothetical protein